MSTWQALATDLSTAEDLQSAFDSIARETARLLRTRTCIVQPIDGDWKVLAQARGGLDLRSTDLPDALRAVSLEAGIGALDLRSIGQGSWTTVCLGQAGRAALVLLAAGEHETLAPLLADLAVWLPLALNGVRRSRSRRDADALVVDVHAMTRRMARLGGTEAVARYVVDQVARSIEADRIALAIHRADEDRLAIVATHGYATTEVQNVRIEPGAWVMGHVFTSCRPLLVRDVRRLGPTGIARRPYRTFSFAAVPLIAGDGAFGVLAATDKRDGSAFDESDKVALRVIGGVASVGLLAARFDREAERLSHAANIDSLTGLFNRTWFDTRLHQEIERAKRTDGSLALLMADIDDFKLINDGFGHPTGDAVLRAVGNVLRSAIRVFDVCSRYGGDEFAILMPGSDQASAVNSAERIRRRVVEAFAHDHTPPLQPTLSVGVAFIEPDDTAADLIRRADECLYRAKADGKNTVRSLAGRGALRGLPSPRSEGPGSAWPSALDE